MAQPWKRPLVWSAVGASVIGALLCVGFWGLRYEPDFYSNAGEPPSEQRHKRAEKFVSQSLQLRNDIVNEAHWEAVFTDQAVNAWLAEDLVESFADYLPGGVGEPRILFEPDRITLAFRYQDGAIPTVVWAVIRASVSNDNELTLVIEKLQAGAFPMPMDQMLERLSRHARERGLDVSWSRLDGQPVATIRYVADADRKDVVLESLQVAQGWIRLSGRSDLSRGKAVDATLPNRSVIQSRFRNKNRQVGEPEAESNTGAEDATARSSPSPRST
jgi:hypothetical protein